MDTTPTPLPIIPVPKTDYQITLGCPTCHARIRVTNKTLRLGGFPVCGEHGERYAPVPRQPYTPRRKRETVTG